MKAAEAFDLADNRDAKLVVVGSMYSAMVSIAQELRSTVERMTVWSTGIVLALDGWIITGDVQLDLRRRVLVSCAVIIFGLIATFVVRTLHRRYLGVASVIRRINEVQMAHRPGAFLDGEALFPTQWKDFGTPRWREPIFRVSYLSLVIVSAFGACVVWVL